MDTPQDFKFLLESVAQHYNPYYQGEYLIIQTYPRAISLRVVNRSFNYQEAKQWCDSENLSHDYTSFDLRIFHQGKLYRVNSDGTHGTVDVEENFTTEPRSLNIHYDQNSHNKITDKVVVWFQDIWNSYRYDKGTRDEFKDRIQLDIKFHHITLDDLDDLGERTWDDWTSLNNILKNHPIPDIEADKVEWEAVGQFLVHNFNLKLQEIENDED